MPCGDASTTLAAFSSQIFFFLHFTLGFQKSYHLTNQVIRFKTDLENYCLKPRNDEQLVFYPPIYLLPIGPLSKYFTTFLWPFNPSFFSLSSLVCFCCFSTPLDFTGWGKTLTQSKKLYEEATFKVNMASICLSQFLREAGCAKNVSNEINLTYVCIHMCAWVY